MTIEEILAGESKNVEFKENLPEKSIKYMKSVVAFANGTGGKIIFGIADKTREVVGFDKEDVFKKMDAIANAVSDSCEPAIIPDITLQTVDGKTVIVVEVSEGRQRPYYIKALGRDGGVYVRVAGTTRLADEYMIKELLFEGSNRYYDQALCTGLNVTDEDIDALCKAMKEQAVKNARTEEQKASIKDVGRQQLRSWGILIERDEKDYPSNAFAILTGNGGLHVATQCGVFKGTTKAVFVDRREYTGPLWEQIDEAFQFVLRNIHLGATIVGIYRQDVYFENFYDGILQVANMQKFFKEHSDGFHTTEAKGIWKEYTESYYRMDTYYRLFHLSFQKSLETSTLYPLVFTTFM